MLVERQCRQILRRHFGVAVVVYKGRTPLRNGARIVASPVSFASVNLAIIVFTLQSLGSLVFVVPGMTRFVRQSSPIFWYNTDVLQKVAAIPCGLSSPSRRIRTRQPRGLARSDETSNFKPNEHVLRGDAQGTLVVPGVSFCTRVFGNGFGRPHRRARVKGARPLYCCLLLENRLNSD